MTLVTCRPLSSRPMPKSSTPALFPTMVRSLTPLSTKAWIRFSGIPHRPKPPAAMVIPSFNRPCNADSASVWTLLIAGPFVSFSDGVGGLHQHPAGQLHRQVTLGDFGSGDGARDELRLLAAGGRQVGRAVPERPEQRQIFDGLAVVPRRLRGREHDAPGGVAGRDVVRGLTGQRGGDQREVARGDTGEQPAVTA